MLARKPRYLILIVVLVLIPVIWSVRIQLAESLAGWSMRNAGLEDVTADITRLDSTQTELSRLLFTMPAADSRLSLEALEIRASYSPSQLYNARLESLVIGRLALHYENSADSQQHPGDSRAETDVREIIGALKSALSQYIFFDSLSIRQILLNGKPFAVLDGKSLQFYSASENGVIQAELTVIDPATAEPASGSAQIIISRLSAQALVAELRLVQAAGVPAARLDLKLDESSIVGSYRVQPKDLVKWLQTFMPIPAIASNDSIGGEISFDFEADGPVHAGFTAASDSLVLDNIYAADTELDVQFEYSTDESARLLKVLDGSFIRAGKVSAGEVSFADSRINLQAEFSRDAANWIFTASPSADSLTVNYDSRQLKLAGLFAQLTGDTEQLHASGRFSLQALPGLFKLDLNHSFSTATGELEITTSETINLNAENHQLSQLLTPWPYPFDLLAGKLSPAARVSWSKNAALRLAARLALTDAGGHLGEIIFSGLSFEHELEILPSLHTSSAGQIRLSQVDAGVTVSNITAQLFFQAVETGLLPAVKLKAIHGDILGGSIFAENQLYDLNRSKNNLQINATDIDLAEIVETQQLENIMASGRLDGSLPVEINTEGVFIEHGSFNNNHRAGTIRYQPTAGTDRLKQNRLTGIALDALSDFRYTYLQAGVNYVAGGLLTINLELKGTSPALDANRPVHLNINTEQNLTSLLKSLRFAQGVSESIDKKVRRQYENSNTN